MDEWRPYPKQEIFHQCPAYEVLYGGTKGPGKTESILRESLRQVNKPGYRACIFRRTFPRLGEIIDRSFKYFKRIGLVYSGHDAQLKLPAWTSPTGAKIAFSHCQHEENKYDHQGREWHYMGFDQLEEFTETQYLFLIAQNRTSDKNIKCYVRATANPGGIGHAWVRKRFIVCLAPEEIKYFKRIADEDCEVSSEEHGSLSRCFIPASVYDNLSIMQNDPGYIARLEALPETDKQALLYGNWDVFKGQFFDMWRHSIHVQERVIEKEYLKFLALDYGYTNPSCVGWWMVDFDGRLHKYRELYVEGYTYERLGYEVIDRTPSDERIDYCVADPAIWGDKPHHKDKIQGESGGETLARIWAGFTKLIKADNNRITGWGRMRIMLTPYIDQHNEKAARMTFSPSCKNSIRTIPTLIYDEKRPEDLNTDGEDHAADESRYAVMSRPEGPVKEERPARGTVEDWDERERRTRVARGEEEDVPEIEEVA